MMKHPWYLFLLVSCLLIAGCGNNDKPLIAAPPTPAKPVIMQPFRFHKMIEVSPGQDYDILSWGRGASKVGAFEILHSDSAAAKFTTTTGDLDGTIVDVFNTDMDLDGNPEILIQTKGNDTLYYTHVSAFEFTNGKAEKLDFPKLNEQQKKGYRGSDNFYVKDGALIREFPIYSGTGKEAKPTGEKRELQYGLRNNSFTVKQLNKDAIDVKAVKPHINAPVKHTETKKKHTTREKKHKKKKHRRHHSDEG